MYALGMSCFGFAAWFFDDHTEHEELLLDYFVHWRCKNDSESWTDSALAILSFLFGEIGRKWNPKPGEEIFITVSR